MKTNILITSIILFLFVGCQTKVEFTDAVKQKVLEEVKAESNRMWTFFNSDFNEELNEKIFEFFEKDAEKLWQTTPVVASFNFELIRSNSEFEEMITEMNSTRIRNEITITDSHYLVLSEIHVLEVITADYFITSKEGEVFGPFQMVNDNLWQKKEGVWKVLHSHQTYRKKPQPKIEE
jgi:hypothetical protein